MPAASPVGLDVVTDDTEGSRETMAPTVSTAGLVVVPDRLVNIVTG